MWTWSSNVYPNYVDIETMNVDMLKGKKKEKKKPGQLDWAFTAWPGEPAFKAPNTVGKTSRQNIILRVHFIKTPQTMVHILNPSSIIKLSNIISTKFFRQSNY